jgi:hypothetical protein
VGGHDTRGGAVRRRRAWTPGLMLAHDFLQHGGLIWVTPRPPSPAPRRSTPSCRMYRRSHVLGSPVFRASPRIPSGKAPIFPHRLAVVPGWS